jgi:5-methylcytosine-specific restriction enzyme A
MKNARPPQFRPPWLPNPAQRLAAWRKEQRRRNPVPPARAAGRHDKDWKELRAQVLADEPMCREFARHGIERQAVTVDHIIPMRDAPERRLDRTNVQPICWPSHHRKTNRYDGGFGRKRGVDGAKGKKLTWNVPMRLCKPCVSCWTTHCCNYFCTSFQ